MRNILIAFTIVLLSSCTTTHNHYHTNNNDNDFAQSEIINHSHHDRGDHIVVVVKHRHGLTKTERRRLKNWCHRHYKHHRKRVKVQFVLG